MRLLLAVLAAVQQPAPAPAPPARLAARAPDTAHVVIVATTDVHGRIRGWDYTKDEEAPGGLARAATLLETLRARYPDAVAPVDAGDPLQGNPFAPCLARPARRHPHPLLDALTGPPPPAATPA